MTADRLLQTAGGILLLVIGYIAANALSSVQAHEIRITKIETQIESQKDILREIKEDLKEIKARLGAKDAKP
jgi:type II secretory pathway component PulM